MLGSRKCWDFAVNQMRPRTVSVSVQQLILQGISKRINQPWFASFCGAKVSTVAN